MKSYFSRSTLLYLFPTVVVAWTLFLRAWSGPFYLSSIDPEYMYLISGLNCATFNFNLIGHIDHPGTPLQLLTGLFFRLIHLVYGPQGFRADVISDPERYLTLSSVMLAALTFFLLLRLGQLAYRYTSSILGSLVLQAASFYTLVNAGILARYSPDRLMTVIILLFFIACLRYWFDPGYGPKKFALFSGMIMGAGLMTKFNFAPLLLMPLFLVPDWKNRRNYLYMLAGTAFIFFLPVSSKYRSFWDIFTGMITHKGLYGSGEKGLLDAPRFLDHILQIFSSHPSFTLVVLLGLIIVAIGILNPGLRSRKSKEFQFLMASLIAIVAGLLITAKHYKGYYALPYLSLIPMMLFSLIRILDEMSWIRKPRLVSACLFGLLLAVPMVSIARHFTAPNQDLREKELSRDFMASEIGLEDFVLITPSWKSTPLPENAMVLGVSYFHHRWRHYLEFERIYPRVLTWEGADAPLQYMRMKDASLEEVLMNGTGIYLYSKPGLNTPEVCRYLEQHAAEKGIGIVRDTLYADTAIGEYLIRYRNTDGWKRFLKLSCGFEKRDSVGLLTENGMERMNGKFRQSDRFRAEGRFAIELNGSLRNSPAYLIQNFQIGDFISVEVKARKANGEPPDQVHIRLTGDDSHGNTFSSNALQKNEQIDTYWYQVSRSGRIEQPSAGNSLKCEVVFDGEGSVYLDDFTITLYRRWP
ncbi:MAG: hypothetical protein ACWGNV_12990 [Bacteroidales bacterium]